MKYYAVRTGKQPGIYESWTECREQTHGFSGAVFKAFEDKEAAELFLNETAPERIINKALPFAFIDGSFNRGKGLYSYGGFIFTGTEYRIIQGTGDAADYMQYRNITGEIRGALEIIKTAVQLEIKELNLYHDYAGIEKWITGEWDCKTKLSQYYRAYYEKRRGRLKVNFVNVKGHTGIEGHEIADYLAKEAAGAKLRKKDVKALAEFREAAARNATLNLQEGEP